MLRVRPSTYLTLRTRRILTCRSPHAYSKSASSNARVKRDGFSSLAAAGALLSAVGAGAYCLVALGRSARYDANQAIAIPRNEFQSPATAPPSLHELKPLEKFTKSVDVDQALREHEQSHTIDPATGIIRYDIAEISSNKPCEDDHAEAIVPVPFGSWSFFAVLDGHSGWETSAWLRENLVPAVIGSLADLYELYGPNARPPAEEIDNAIKSTFKTLDTAIVDTPLDDVFRSPSRAAAVRALAPAYAGSCALLAFFDSESRRLRIALTGDVRAVLGRAQPDGTYAVHVLSADQNGANPEERARIAAEHPGEDVVKGDRVAGLGVSRAFGDARYKWPCRVQKVLHAQYLGRTPWPHILTPPYLTAEPVVTTTEVLPGDFVIIATDGLWECLSNEEAVGLVGIWVGKERDEQGTARMALPVAITEEDRTVRYPHWTARKLFVNVDANAATHLVRNALGGADKDLATALLSMRPPHSRVFRDDITATVVFFGKH